MQKAAEALSWRQLGFHGGPIIFANVDGYFDTFIKFVNEMISSGFVSTSFKDCFVACNDIAAIEKALKTYKLSDRAVVDLVTKG